MYRIDEGDRAIQSMRRLSGRGGGYWTDGSSDKRIYFVTIGYQLVALHSHTGRPVINFGVNGIVDLKQNNAKNWTSSRANSHGTERPSSPATL